MNDRLAEPQQKESPMYSRTFHEPVLLSRNDDVTVTTIVSFEGWRDNNFIEYYGSDTTFSFPGGINLSEFNDWKNDVHESLRMYGYKIYE